MQHTIPFQEFTKGQLANRDVARANSKRGADETILIPADQVVVRESTDGTKFNPRNEDNYGDIPGLAKQILENGQLVAGIVDVLSDGRFAVCVGHRRLRAVLYNQEQTLQPQFFKANINKAGKITEVDRLLQSWLSQSEQPLAQHEVADLFTRLLDHGLTQVQIADKTGKSPAYVSQMISFSREPERIKELVRMGRLSVNTALKAKKEIPDANERLNAIQSAEEKKWNANEKRREDFADNLEYDDDLKSHTVKIKDNIPSEDIEKRRDNTIKGKRLKIEEIASTNTVVVYDIKSIRSKIEKLAEPEGNPDYNKGYANCLGIILALFEF